MENNRADYNFGGSFHVVIFGCKKLQRNCAKTARTYSIRAPRKFSRVQNRDTSVF